MFSDIHDAEYFKLATSLKVYKEFYAASAALNSLVWYKDGRNAEERAMALARVNAAYDAVEVLERRSNEPTNFI